MLRDAVAVDDGGGGGGDGGGGSDETNAALLRMAGLASTRVAARATPSAPSSMVTDATTTVQSEQLEGANATVWPVEGELALGAAAAR